MLFPFYCELPAGVFVFWVTNSLWSLAQGAAVRRTATSRALRGLAPSAAAPSTASTAAASTAAAARASATLAPPAAAAAPAAPAFLAAAPALATAAAAALPRTPPPPASAPLESPVNPSASPAAVAASSAAGTPAAAEGAAPSEAASAAAAEEAALRAGVEQAAAAGELTAWVVAHVELSKALLRTARAADAIAHLWPAVQDAPKEASAPLRYQLALALALDRQHASAEPLLRQVIELEPAYIDASLALVSVLHAQGKTRDALALLEQLKASQPEMAGWCEQQAVAMRAALAAAPG